MPLYLVRHGESTITGILHSRDPSLGPLSERGRKEAEAVAAALARLGFKGPVFSSPIRRAVETALYISRDVIIEEKLKEIDMGEWELKRLTEAVGFESYRSDPASHPPPGGEGAESVAARVEDFLRSAEEYEAAVAVSHWHVIATAVALTLGAPLSNIYRIRIDTGSITAIDLKGKEVLFVNYKPIFQS